MLRLYIPVYALTLLLSAALLFSVQPMFSKMVLPMLGGTPQVWNTAMLFFQAVLLGGYAYAHGTTRIMSVRAQAILHIILLCVFVLVLPIAIPDGWVPPTDEDPTMWQLSLMLVAVGGPFFVLSGSAPMLQRWFSKTDHPDAHNPYFLYGASNLGSMTSLLAYPFVFEPLMTVSEQSMLWMFSYSALIVFVLLCAAMVWRTPGKTEEAKNTKQAEHITWSRRALWLVLAFVPSSMMLGVTTHITTDIAAVPLLWIVPLAIYVGTFIIVFARKEIFSRKQMHYAQALLLFLVIVFAMSPLNLDINFLIEVFVHLLLFTACALVCHSELVRSRPGASKLTEFYLIMSLGGALGGFFNAIIAPQFFVTHFEYGFALMAAAAMRWSADENYSLAEFKKPWNRIALGIIAVFAIAALIFAPFPNQVILIGAFVVSLLLASLMETRWSMVVAVVLLLVAFPLTELKIYKNEYKLVSSHRNFFGILKVIENDDQRALIHGTTNHGMQRLKDDEKLTQLAYYSKYSPLGDVFEYLNTKQGPQRIAAIGLGVGVVACYQKSERHFDFFEINPTVVEIAENPELFTFLSDCGSPYDIILGDGRLTLQNQPDESYDLIIVDAFTSDNIPVHLITKEAIELYAQKLKPDGIIAFHVTNRYLELEPVVVAIGDLLNLNVYGRFSIGGNYDDTEMEYYTSIYVAAFKDENYKNILEKKSWTPGIRKEGLRPWDDQYSNIISVLNSETHKNRLKKQETLAEDKPEN